MKKFLYLKKQSGEGCDYTIGCGINFEIIHAQSFDDALSEITCLPDDWKEITDVDELHDVILDTDLSMMDETDDLNRHLVKAMLFEINDKNDILPILKQKFNELNEHKQNLVRANQEKSELEAYKKLKKKFENKT